MNYYIDMKKHKSIDGSIKELSETERKRQKLPFFFPVAIDLG